MHFKTILSFIVHLCSPTVWYSSMPYQIMLCKKKFSLLTNASTINFQKCRWKLTAATIVIALEGDFWKYPSVAAASSSILSAASLLCNIRNICCVSLMVRVLRLLTVAFFSGIFFTVAFFSGVFFTVLLRSAVCFRFFLLLVFGSSWLQIARRSSGSNRRKST